jgi:hypothetical protein
MKAAGVLGLLALAFATPVASAPPAISIAARPPIVGTGDALQLFGHVGSSRGGDEVVVEARQCDGPPGFRYAGKVTTTSFGAWSFGTRAVAKTDFRARRQNTTSEAVSVRVRPAILLQAEPRHRFLVIVTTADFLVGKRAVLQRRSASRWLRVRSFTLHRSGPATYDSVQSNAEIRAFVRRGSHIRAVLPQSQAGRCYLGGVSNTVKA